jgi:hypothetical protein
MKNFYLPLAALGLMLTSCGGGGSCDMKTAEGAADCGCGYSEEYKKAEEAGDEAKMKELDTKMDTWENDVEKEMEAGTYTENDVEAALEAKGCDL